MLVSSLNNLLGTPEKLTWKNLLKMSEQVHDTVSIIPSLSEKEGMELFADLVTEISATTKTNDKLDALVNYFAVAPEKDKVWVIALFSGRRPKRVVNSTLLWTWCNDIAGIP